MIGLGWLGQVGSPADIGTFLAVTVLVYYQIRPQLDDVSAAVVALARRVQGVDEDLLQGDLDVPDRKVERVEERVVPDGGDR